jgi:hypothetical protein
VADTYGLFHWLLLSPENYSAIEGSYILVHPLTLSLSDSWVFMMSSRVGDMFLHGSLSVGKW